LFLLLVAALALPRVGTAAERERVNAVLASDPAAIEKILARFALHSTAREWTSSRPARPGSIHSTSPPSP